MSASDFTCPFCHYFFSSPVTLPCSHHMCQGCVQVLYDFSVLHSLSSLPAIVPLDPPSRVSDPMGHVETGGSTRTLACAKCAVTFEVNGGQLKGGRKEEKGTEELGIGKVNMLLEEATEKFKKERNQTPVCGHDCGKEATVECAQCRAAFCADCFAVLHAKTAFMTHSLLPIGKLNEKKAGECPVHNKELELYCNTCQLIACLTCYSFGEHKNHICVPIADHFAFIQQRMASLIPESKRSADKLKSLSVDVANTINRVNEVYDDLDLKIIMVKQQLLDAIEQRFFVLNKKSRFVRETKLSRLQTQLASLVQAPKQFEKLQGLLENSLESDDHWEQMSILALAEKEMSVMNISSLELAPCEDASVIERLDATASLKQLSIFGVISTAGEVKLATENRANAIQQAHPPIFKPSAVSNPLAVHFSSNSTTASIPQPKPAEKSDFELKQEKFRNAFHNPILFKNWTNAAQIRAQASKFDITKSLSLVDQTHIGGVQVLHFDSIEPLNSWIAFDFKDSYHMVRSRVYNGADSEWQIQYSDDYNSWKTCANVSFNSTEWNDFTWRSVGAHQFWRFLMISNTGKRWFEKFEWYFVPNEIIIEMKTLLATAKNGKK